jgi:hypothetical protein
MAGVDPLLQVALGSKYSKSVQGPQRAGWEVAKIMRNKGFKAQGSEPCGDDCLCGNAIIWVPV